MYPLKVTRLFRGNAEKLRWKNPTVFPANRAATAAMEVLSLTSIFILVAGSQAPLQLFLKGSDDAAERDNVRVQMDRKLILGWVLWGFKFVYMICLDVNIQFWMKFPLFQGYICGQSVSLKMEAGTLVEPYQKTLRSSLPGSADSPWTPIFQWGYSKATSF